MAGIIYVYMFTDKFAVPAIEIGESFTASRVQILSTPFDVHIVQ